ncbi:MAG: hypothetical protein ACOVKC_00280 [Brevundimonas sp.]
MTSAEELFIELGGTTAQKLALELRRRASRRAIEPLPEGSLFDDVRRSQDDLFTNTKPKP